MRRAVLTAATLLLALVLLGALTLPAYADSVTWQVAGSNYIYDWNGITKLEAGDYVQLWDVDGDALLHEAVIGDGLMPAGQFSKMGLNLTGTYTINIRAYNEPKANANDPGACSGISAPQTITFGEIGFVDVDFAGFSTTTCPSDPTAVHLSLFRATSASVGRPIWAGLGLLAAAVFGLTYLLKKSGEDKSSAGRVGATWVEPVETKTYRGQAGCR